MLLVTVKIAEGSRKKYEYHLPEKGRAITAIEWLPWELQNYIMVGDDHGDIWLWDWENGEVVFHQDTPLQKINALDFGYLHKRLAIAGPPRNIIVWDWEDIQSSIENLRLTKKTINS